MPLSLFSADLSNHFSISSWTLVPHQTLLLTRALSSAHYSSVLHALQGDFTHSPNLSTTYMLKLPKAIFAMAWSFPHTQSPDGPSCSTVIINPTHPKANASSAKPPPDMHFILQTLSYLIALNLASVTCHSTTQPDQKPPSPPPSPVLIQSTNPVNFTSLKCL